MAEPTSTTRRETWRHRDGLGVVDNETRLAERAVDGRDEQIDSSRCQAEEVEISSLPPNVTADDQRSLACEREVCRFLEPGDDL